MKARLIQISRDAPDAELLAQAGEIIRAGGLVAFPTETVYGLGGDAFDKAAAKKIYAAKGRPSDNPLIVHIASMDSLERVASCIPDSARALADRFWPGPLTMIFKKNDSVPMEVTGGLDTVAVRLPGHEVARAFIAASGGFVAAPSANLSGRPSPTKVAHVIEDLGERIDMIIDAGDVDIGIESTIVDFTSDAPVILRPGYISAAQVEETAGSVKIDPAVAAHSNIARPKAPGMKYRHYAPRGELVIIQGDTEEVVKEINSLVRQKEGMGAKAAVLCSEETKGLYECGCIVALGSLSNEEEIAHRLFDSLRRLDENRIEYIFSESFYIGRMGTAIMNRLLKAAGHKVIDLKGKGRIVR